MKRIFLFLATNLAILLVLSITLSLLGFNGFMDSQGINLDLQGLLVYAAVFGFGGAFISLLMSKWIAKRMTGAYVITRPRDATEAWLLETVRRQAQQAGIGVPEVAVYGAQEI